MYVQVPLNMYWIARSFLDSAVGQLNDNFYNIYNKVPLLTCVSILDNIIGLFFPLVLSAY